MDPGVAVFGRTAGLEVDLGRILGIDYREQPEPDDEHAWEAVRAEVLARRPTMLSGDILYLDYREFKIHFPAHRFVLLGFDDASQKAFIADRIRPVAEACSYGALAQSRAEREDARWVASFNARCIEKFGNGGGNFRRLYAGFLAWARALDPKLAPEETRALATRAADGWTAISERFALASAEDAPRTAWAEAAALAHQLADVEQSLFERLAAQAG